MYWIVSRTFSCRFITNYYPSIRLWNKKRGEKTYKPCLKKHSKNNVYALVTQASYFNCCYWKRSISILHLKSSRKMYSLAFFIEWNVLQNRENGSTSLYVFSMSSGLCYLFCKVTITVCNSFHCIFEIWASSYQLKWLIE